jgi:hypothetical protein
MIRQKAIPVLAILLLVSGCIGAGERRTDTVSPPLAGELKQVKIWYSEYHVDRTIRTRMGDMTIYRGYSMKVHTVKTYLDKITTDCYNKLKAADSVTFRYETNENGVIITRGKKVTADDPEYLYGLLQNLEKEINYVKNQENIDPDEKVVFEYY